MGTLFRSQEMTLSQLYLQADAAYSCVSELGELGLVQFRDLNPDVNAFQRKFVNDVRRCDEMERRLRFLLREMEKENVTAREPTINPPAPLPHETIELEAKFEQLEKELKEINANQERLDRNFLELTELKFILREAANFFEKAEAAMASGDLGTDAAGLVEAEAVASQNSPLSFVAGVINRTKMASFERVLWRACRGNVFLRYHDIEVPLKDPATGDDVQKVVFIIFFQGNRLRARVTKICEGFNATVYPCPESSNERREMAAGVSSRIQDLNQILSQTSDQRQQILVAVSNNISAWRIKVRKMKSIYHTLNLFNDDVTQKCLIGECWCPVSRLDEIQSALQQGQENAGSLVTPVLNHVPTTLPPPTFNVVNKFTSGFQNIVDAYGVATYHEVNPAPYTIITFPFLFAVMFGDCGHGTLMMLFALFMVVFEKKLAHLKGGEILGTFYSGRYIILMMGLFSMYTGFIYNDCFSKSFNIFGSSWHIRSLTEEELQASDKDIKLNVDIDFDKHNPYPLGLDPIWQVAANKLTFTNSFKMKLSVVLGVMQMMFGVVLGIFNHVHYKRYINIWTQWIPEVLFLGFIFGYLVLLIFYKWILVNSSFNSTLEGPPSLLITLINMFLSFGNVPPAMEFFGGQAGLQSFLVVVAVLCIPWMLLAKPIVLFYRNKRGKAGYTKMEGNDESADTNELVETDEAGESEGSGFNIGDIFVHQAIHTIEFCLGCISNTASYLRLWALSLAHAELSEVLWNMMMRIGLKGITGGIQVFAIFIVFAIWAVLTVAILLVMEGLSAFLHALRLHWVEFQNKFYDGNGYKFNPFSFNFTEETE